MKHSYETTQAKYYCPIACQNITCKQMINPYIIDHCTTNNVITSEQARGKQRSWRCTDHLLINEMILDEAKQHRCNLLMMWFDYKKSFQFCSTWLDPEGTGTSSSTIENNQHDQIINGYMGHKALSQFYRNWYHQISNWCFARRLHGINCVRSQHKSTIVYTQ